MTDTIDPPDPRVYAQRYRTTFATVVTAPLDNGRWVATYPGFAAEAASEPEALLALSAEIAGAAREVALLVSPQSAPTIAGTKTIAQTSSPSKHYVLIWARSAEAARLYFGLPSEKPVEVVKDSPETDEERAKYHPEAKLFAIGIEADRTSGIEHATAGVRRVK